MKRVPDDLPACLQRWAAGLPGVETAVQLLATSPWVSDPDFVDECIVVMDDAHPPVAAIDWSATDGFLAARPSADQRAVKALRIARELAREPYRS